VLTKIGCVIYFWTMGSIPQIRLLNVSSKNPEEKITDAHLRDEIDKYVTKGTANKMFHSGQ